MLNIKSPRTYVSYDKFYGINISMYWWCGGVGHEGSILSSVGWYENRINDAKFNISHQWPM